ncbi:phage minor tail protein L [Escherichia coli]|uniref:phage minor tail protein L n=2 Tax=Escherichia coli TaxID=562 RepID=UPI003905F289
MAEDRSTVTAATGMTVTPASTSVVKGRSITLTVAFQPEGATDKSFRAVSADKTKATVSVSGMTITVKGVAAGKVNIPVVSGNGELAVVAGITVSRWRIEQCSELSAVSASFVLSTPTETDGAVFPGRIMLANTCTWTYRGDECGYSGPAVADEYDQPTSDITKDKCSKCLSGCKFRNNVGNFGGFLSINKLSQ